MDVGGQNAGGTAVYGCSNSGPGICCNTDTCYTLTEIRAFLGQGGDGSSGAGARGEPSEGGAAGDAGGAGGSDSSCPSAVGHQLEVCSYITADLGPVGDQCCYVVRSGGCCGRPFVVDGARVAASAERGDWRSALSGAAEELDAPTRAALARAWTDDALMEHASVASFARFSLELMTIGAPSSLVAAAHHAALDEVAHALDCFALATRFGDREVGPSTFDLRGAQFGRDLEELAVAVLREGAIGETLAAALASEQGALASDETCSSVLARIARDEEEHSLLAWRFLRYAVDRGGASIAARLVSEIRDVPRELEPPATVAPAQIWNRYGRLTAEQQANVVEHTWREVILPALTLLCEQPGVDAKPRGPGVDAMTS